MARQTCGKTPWCAAWIAAMESHRLQPNRLPRGRTYANRGRRLVLLSILSSASRAACSVEVTEKGETDFSDTDFRLVYLHGTDGEPRGFAFPEPLTDALCCRAEKTQERSRPLAQAMRLFMNQPLDASLEAHSPSSRFLNAGAFVAALAPFDEGRFAIRYAALSRNEKGAGSILILQHLLLKSLEFAHGTVRRHVMDPEIGSDLGHGVRARGAGGRDTDFDLLSHACCCDG